MRRLGHSSSAAALMYQHAAEERDSEIARALDTMIGATAAEAPRPSDLDAPPRQL